MKLRELTYLFGIRPAARVFGHETKTVNVPGVGDVQYAKSRKPFRGEPFLVALQELDDLKKFILPGDFAVDVGAAWGDSSVPIALACGAEGCVLALEPNPFNFAVLAANTHLNPTLTNIISLPVAASQTDGPLVFSYGTPTYDNGGDASSLSRWRRGSFDIEVEGRRLEPLLRERFSERLPRLRYVKTDTEGADLTVLRSIELLLREHRPHIKAEVFRHAAPDTKRAIFRFFTELGYVVHLKTPETLFGPRIVSEDDMINPKTFDVFAVPN